MDQLKWAAERAALRSGMTTQSSGGMNCDPTTYTCCPTDAPFWQSTYCPDTNCYPPAFNSYCYAGICCGINA